MGVDRSSLAIVLLWLFIFGSFFVFRLGMGRLVAEMRAPWVTHAYYLEKAAWMVLAALALLGTMRVIASRRFALLAIMGCLCAIPLDMEHALAFGEDRRMVSYDGIRRVMGSPRSQPLMFYHYSSWASDAYLNSIAGLHWENYDGHPGQGPHRKSPGFMPTESFAGRAWYTSPKDTLCDGQKYLGSSGLILTRDEDLRAQRLQWCDGPAQIVVVE